MKIRLAKKILHLDKDLRPTYHLAYGDRDKIYVLIKAMTRLRRYSRKRKRGGHEKTAL